MAHLMGGDSQKRLGGGILCDVGENDGNSDYLVFIDDNATMNQLNETINQLCVPLEVGLCRCCGQRPKFYEPVGWVGFFCRFEAHQNILCCHRQVVIVLFL
jgi:hypothetical protein